MKILVIEDSRVQQIILRALFTECGIEPDFVQNVKEAIEAIDNGIYQFVFAGYSLPDGTGVDVARHIRKSHAQNQEEIPGVVLLTTEEKRSILNEALSAGVTRIINRANTTALQVFIRELADSISDGFEGIGAVLLIEDHFPTAQVFQAMIEATGSTCMVCDNSQKALELISEQNFDLIIIDYILNDPVDGLDILLTIKQQGGKSIRLPVILISAKDDVSLRITAFKNGAADFLVKPINEEELALRAKNLIATKKYINRMEEQREQLRNIALTDQLTTLYNRHFLVQFAPKRLAEAKRHMSDTALIVCDLDHFKTINDTYGHEKGDDVLRGVAALLKQSCRKEDMAIRLGGEEFLLMLPHCGKEAVMAKAEEIRTRLSKIKPGGLKVTGSFGATYLPAGDSAEFSDLFMAADEAVYEAKEAGRNKVVYHQVKQSIN